MYFADSCEDTLRTLPVLQHDEDDVEDLDTDGEDHAADEIRYACMSRPWKPKLQVQKQGLSMPLLPTQYTFNDLVAQSRKKRIEMELNRA